MRGCRCAAGFLVDRIDGVVVDKEGPMHTLHLAKLSRMLGGNTGYFDGDENSILLCMHDKQKFNTVWISCTRADLPKVFDLAPRDEDAKHAFAAEDLKVGCNASVHSKAQNVIVISVALYVLLSLLGTLACFSHTVALPLQAYAETAVKDFKSSWHAVDVQGAEGATVIKEGLLRGVNHFRTLHNRRKPKPYLTESEEAEVAKAKAAQKEADQKAKAAAKAEAEKVKAAAKEAKDAQKKPPRKAAGNSKRKRSASIHVDDTDDDDDANDRHDDS
eukprot:6205674-Pleurochrysis_carterae.AAC.4